MLELSCENATVGKNGLISNRNSFAGATEPNTEQHHSESFSFP